MTRERDRIQKNANKYIVKDCPSICFGKLCSKPFLSYALNCQDCTDCVIKQVIDLCKKEAVINYPKREKEYITVNGYQAILNMFDIEEIRE